MKFFFLFSQKSKFLKMTNILVFFPLLFFSFKGIWQVNSNFLVAKYYFFCFLLSYFSYLFYLLFSRSIYCTGFPFSRLRVGKERNKSGVFFRFDMDRLYLFILMQNVKGKSAQEEGSKEQKVKKERNRYRKLNSLNTKRGKKTVLRLGRTSR